MRLIAPLLMAVAMQAPGAAHSATAPPRVQYAAATLARSWPGRKPLTADGAMLVMQSGPGQFYILGSGLTVSFLRDPDVDHGIAGIAGIEQLAWQSVRWTVAERLSGDQSNQGRALLMDADAIHLYRVELYTIDHDSE